MNSNLIFYNENDEIINHTIFEADEQKLADKYIKNHHVVLELGARYGTVSYNINKNVRNSTNHVAVEPDSRVWGALEKNKQLYNSNYHIVKGFISNKSLGLANIDSGYGTTTVIQENSDIPSYTLDYIQNYYNLNFNVLVADCEGFLEIFLDENPELYNNLRLIIYEADYPEKCNYSKIENILRSKEFVHVEKGFQNVWIKFNVDAYKYLNEDLKECTDKEAILHFNNHGKNESRIYYFE
jgi:FkbM family methyltransferase